MGLSLNGASLNYSDEYDHDRDNQKKMDEAAHGVGANHPQRPHDEQDYRNGEKHLIVSSAVSKARRRPNNLHCYE
jgi:hypothetical protein